MIPIPCQHQGCTWAYFIFAEDDVSMNAAGSAYADHCQEKHRGLLGVPEYDVPRNEKLDELIDRYTPHTTGPQRENQRFVLRHAAYLSQRAKPQVD